MKYIALIIWCSIQFVSTGIAQRGSLNRSLSMATWTGYAEVGSYRQSGSIEFSSAYMAIIDQSIRSAKIEFDMTSITHQDKQLEAHLKAEDFFYADKFPKATFDLLEIKDNQATGTLTMRGKSNLISFPVDCTFNDNQVVIQGKVSIDRTKFDIKYNSSSYFQDLGNYAIKNLFDVEFTLVYDLNKSE